MSANLNPKRRVVITGIGAVSPIGHTAPETWTAALEGKSGVGPITIFDPKDCKTTIAAEVKNFDPCRLMGPFFPRGKGTPIEEFQVDRAINTKEIRKFGRFIHLGVSAAVEAYGDSGIDAYRSEFAPERFGAIFGVGMGGIAEIQETHNDYLNKGYKRISPYFILQIIPNMPSGHLSVLLNLRGPNFASVSACASSAHGLGEAMKTIQRGDADVILAGGAEAVLCEIGVGGFSSMRALSTRNDDPTKASRPYDKNRDGFVMGEGGAAVMLEEYEFAKKRGAKIYAELAGYGLSSDAYHLTSPSPQGEGGYRSMEMALKDAGIPASEIDYVNAHGTSTPQGDAEEAQAIAKLLYAHNPKVNVSSTKSVTGHMLGAAGAMEAVFCILAIRDGKIPPTMNLIELDDVCKSTGLDFTANKMVSKPVRAALSNSFGFGGTNASLIFKKI